MKIAFSPIYKYQLPEGHRFPMDKYELLPQQLLLENVVEEVDFFHPRACTDEMILRTHSREYLEKLMHLTLSRKEERKIGFPVRADLITRGRHIAHGTYECAIHALANQSVALNIAGGTHHAYADRGEGFCIFNDFAIAANQLLFEKKVGRILIIDLDVHQGNGTAHIFKNRPEVFTFSVHGFHNYPHLKEKSDLDISLPNKTEDKEYLDTIHKNIPILIRDFEPDIIFYLAGVDVIETDRLGKLSLTQHGCYERDHFVFSQAHENNLPIIVSMGGGYSPQIKHIVNAHANTYKAARSIF